MAQKVFERYEKKFLLTGDQYRALCRILPQYMESDDFTNYTIQNIYYDTEKYELIRASIEKPKYKEKMRVRMYGKQVTERAKVFLELKKKYARVVYKRREEMPYLQARAFLHNGIYKDEKSQILREIEYTMHHYGLRPAAYVAYDREAFKGIENSELRLTFDHNIRCRDCNLDFMAGDYGTELLTNGQVLMEVKIPGAMPLWMAELFERITPYQQSFSKYGAYYEYLMKEKNKGGRKNAA